MSTPYFSDTFIDDHVAWFAMLGPRDKMIFLSKVVFHYEKIGDPAGVDAAKQLFGAWSGTENRDDVEQMLRAIAEGEILDDRTYTPFLKSLYTTNEEPHVL